jgi:hypothetical protein
MMKTELEYVLQKGDVIHYMDGYKQTIKYGLVGTSVEKLILGYPEIYDYIEKRSDRKSFWDLFRKH